LVRDVAALANANGGTVYVGLSANPKEAVIGVDDAAEQAKILAEDIERHINPPLQPSIDIHRSDGKNVLVVTVPSGSDKPYVVAPGAIYIRQEGETTAALRDEIVQLVKTGLSAQAGAYPELVPLSAAVAPVEEQREAKPAEQRDRRARGRRRVSGGVTPAEPEAPPVAAVTPFPEAEPRAESVRDQVADAPDPAVPYPRTGVEIVESVERGGVTYHAMRDLRNLKVVHNVTRDSARRLWRYAITQKESHAYGPEQVQWVGERGYWKSYKPRGGDVRYNLVYQRNGAMHVFYGVTDEGMDDAWRSVAPARAAAAVGAAIDDDDLEETNPEGV
jgi:hypothetical protein